jgi:hypothetical protein
VKHFEILLHGGLYCLNPISEEQLANLSPGVPTVSLTDEEVAELEIHWRVERKYQERWTAIATESWNWKLSKSG